MKSRSYLSALVAILLTLGVVSSVVGCAGDGESTSSTASVVSSLPTTSTLVPSSDTTSSSEPLPGDKLSTFQSKDPFIQQVVQSTGNTASTTSPTSATITTRPSGTNTTSYYATTTTKRYVNTTRYVNPTWPVYTTTTRRTTTTRATTTTTAPPTTTTTAPHVHTLKVLSVDKVDGGSAVTFKVDGTIYKNKRAGDVVSTTWGQVQVVDVVLSSKVVTLLHGSETVTLDVGGQIYE